MISSEYYDKYTEKWEAILKEKGGRAEARARLKSLQKRKLYMDRDTRAELSVLKWLLS